MTDFLEQRAEVASIWLAIEISAVAALSEHVCIYILYIDIYGIVNNNIVKIFQFNVSWPGGGGKGWWDGNGIGR